MRERRKGRLGIWVVLLAGMLSAAREYRQQQAAERFCEALIDFIIESI